MGYFPAKGHFPTGRKYAETSSRSSEGKRRKHVLLNDDKGGSYTCSVAAGSWSGQAASRLDVVDSPLAGSRCPGSGAWPPTAPGLQASAPCPPGYVGIATRLCLLLEPGHGRWQIPDYSDCKSHHTLAITNAAITDAQQVRNTVMAVLHPQ
ncbi:unnamed protein product [Nezara viridula]|uniref:G-protein coupled receptors family 2 profile 1 domain-containing protein n=1 Tax=Nezara viridula TaxID=85310 RepID=A0A9P0MQA4_NEZVI|nr:unnamed protein product [Nezara viridula]